MWTAPAEGDDDDEEADVAIDADDDAEQAVPPTGRPISVYGAAAKVQRSGQLVEKPAGKKRGRPIGWRKPKDVVDETSSPRSVSKTEQRYLDLNGLKPEDLRGPAPVSVRGPGNVEANIDKTARVVEARRAAGPEVVDEAKSAAERRRKMEADIRRWTTTTR